MNNYIMSFTIYVLRSIIWEWANQSVWNRQHMYHTSKKKNIQQSGQKQERGDTVDAQYVGCRLTMKPSHRNWCEDIWHLWNTPRMYILSHQAYVLNSETYFELPNLWFWQQRWRRFKSSGFSHVVNRHTDTDVSKHRSAFTFNVKRSKFSCTASSSRLTL